jgi:hypothetical protein
LGVPGDFFEIFYTGGGTPTTIRLNLKIETAERVELGDYLDPSNFLPSLKSIDVIKFCVSFFGCSVYFNDVSKTISINIVEKINLTDSYDWSEYYVTHKSKYTIDQAANNYLNWLDNRDDNDVEKYNNKNFLSFGSGNIETSNTLKDQSILAKFPFTSFGSDFDVFNVYKTNIPLINLEDDGSGPVSFTAIAASATYGATKASSYTVTDTTVFNNRPSIYRLINSSGENIGIFYGIPVSGTLIDIFTPFVATGTGSIYPQKLKYNKIEHGIITVNPSMPVFNFSDNTTLRVYGSSDVVFTDYSNVVYGTFVKKYINKALDQWRNNLAIDNPNSGGFEDPTIKELYFNKISRFLQNPDIEAIMILPEAAFQRFTFDRFIYLKTEQLTGYFFVESIENYVDGNTPVTVNLYMI